MLFPEWHLAQQFILKRDSTTESLFVGLGSDDESSEDSEESDDQSGYMSNGSGSNPDSSDEDDDEDDMVDDYNADALANQDQAVVAALAENPVNEPDCGVDALEDNEGVAGFVPLAALAFEAQQAVQAEGLVDMEQDNVASSNASSSSPFSTPPSMSKFYRPPSSLEKLFKVAGADRDGPFIKSSKDNDEATTRCVSAIRALSHDTSNRHQAIEAKLPPEKPLADAWRDNADKLVEKRLKKPLSPTEVNARGKTMIRLYGASNTFTQEQHGQINNPCAVLIVCTFAVDQTDRFIWALFRTGRLTLSEAMTIHIAFHVALSCLPVVALDISPNARFWNSGRASLHEGEDKITNEVAAEIMAGGYPIIIGGGVDSHTKLLKAMGSSAKDVSKEFGFGKGHFYTNGVTLLICVIHPQNLLPSKGSAIVHAQIYHLLARGLRVAYSVDEKPPLSMVGYVLRKSLGQSYSQIGAYEAAQQERAAELFEGKNVTLANTLPSIRDLLAFAGIATDDQVRVYVMKTKDGRKNALETGGNSPAGIACSIYGIAGGLAEAKLFERVFSISVVGMVPFLKGNKSSVDKAALIHQTEAIRAMFEAQGGAKDGQDFDCPDFAVSYMFVEAISKASKTDGGFFVSVEQVLSQFRSLAGRIYGGRLGGAAESLLFDAVVDVKIPSLGPLRRGNLSSDERIKTEKHFRKTLRDFERNGGVQGGFRGTDIAYTGAEVSLIMTATGLTREQVMAQLDSLDGRIRGGRFGGAAESLLFDAVVDVKIPSLGPLRRGTMTASERDQTEKHFKATILFFESTGVQGGFRGTYIAFSEEEVTSIMSASGLDREQVRSQLRRQDGSVKGAKKMNEVIAVAKKSSGGGFGRGSGLLG